MVLSSTDFFSSVVSNESDGTIENGTFTATVNNSGTINGGLFKIKPTGGLTSPGYTLNVIPPNSIRAVSINYIKNPCYIIPNSDSMFPTNVKVLFWSLRTPFSIGITFDNAQMQLEEWAQNIACYCDADGFFVTFSAPPTNTDTITLGKYDPKPVDPKPEPEPKPEPKPEPEVSTYTLTVKGGTFTYNGGEAITSASVPVDAAVKVTLNQSAVPEGMVFDLWAISDEGLLGNPAVAYNEESFIIPADSATKGSTVTVEAQYRDATIESEPGILGTAAIIGVAGAGTAVLAWQGYRIGMELYEKYFQQEQEEPPVEISTLEGQMTNLLS